MPATSIRRLFRAWPGLVLSCGVPSLVPIVLTSGALSFAATAFEVSGSPHAPGAPQSPRESDDFARWKGRPATVDQLDEAFGEAVSAAITAWAPWAEEHGYVAHVEERGRVVLFLASDARGESKDLALVTKTCDVVEALVRYEPRPAEGRDGAEDPRDAPWVLTPAVMIHARDDAEYGTALEHAATLEPSLASWVPFGKGLTGFTLVKPLASGWAVKAKGRVEWDPENEVVHRLTSLLVLRRFGEVPYWLLAGVSWYVEVKQCKDVYCFPYRNEFVWATEHTSWPTALKQLFKDGRAEFLAGLVGWKRGTFDADRGKEAWGLARFIAELDEQRRVADLRDRSKRGEAPAGGALGAILADLAELRRTAGVRHFDDGRWELIVGWEPSVEQQREILARHLGDDFEARAVASFRGKPAKTNRSEQGKGAEQRR
ncbi:MAG: hypothetical protein R3F49_16270 [Planctomycetota bacterium]